MILGGAPDLVFKLTADLACGYITESGSKVTSTDISVKGIAIFRVPSQLSVSNINYEIKEEYNYKEKNLSLGA